MNSRAFLNPFAIARDMVTAMRLLADSRVSPWLKLSLPGLALLYLISPVDILPDVFPVLTQIDDVAVVILLLRLFVQAAPDFAVDQARNNIKQDDYDGPTVDGEWSVVDDE